MPGPIIRDPFTSPVVPQSAREARDWVDAPLPEGWWTTPQENPGADMMTQVIKALVRATGVTDPASQPMMMMDAAGLRSPKAPIRAYHGSPHDFDKFSTAKIGTGEGGQAYGHGLYFADNPNVAQEYRELLSNRDAAGYKTAHLNARSIVERVGGDAEYAANAVREQLARETPLSANYQRLSDSLKLIESGEYARPLKPSGRTYEVNIHADPDQMLDWDKPLNEQSVSVQTELGTRLNARELGVTGSQAHGGIPTGEDIYSRLGRREVASKYLKDIGIPGIKYLDQGSRAAGEGTRNYVVFDDSLIEVLRKYGFLPPLAATGAGNQPAPRSEGRAMSGLQRGRILNMKPVASH